MDLRQLSGNTLRFNFGIRPFAKALNNYFDNKNIFQFVHCFNLAVSTL